MPTLNEAGVPGYEFDTWYGLHAPVKVPKEIIVKLNAEIVKALSKPEVKETRVGFAAGRAYPIRMTGLSEILAMGKMIPTDQAESKFRREASRR